MDTRIKLSELLKRAQKKIFAGYCDLVEVAYNIIYENEL